MAFDPDAYIQGSQVGNAVSTSTAETTPIDFDPDAYITGTQDGLADVQPVDVPAAAALGLGSAAAMAYGRSGDVITPRMAYDVMGRPVVQAVSETAEKYLRNPLRGGRPIPMPTVDVLRQAAPGMAEQVSKIASSSELVRSPITGRPYPASVPDYRQVQRLVGPEVGQRMTQMSAQGGNAAVLDMLQKDRAAQQALQDPRAAQALEDYRSRVPSGMGKLGRLGGLAARTAARVAGPVGLGVSAYDLYQAAPTLRRLYETGVAGRGGPLGQTADELPQVQAPMPPDYINDIRRRAAERALQ